jgi:hypothetical protein
MTSRWWGAAKSGLFGAFSGAVAIVTPPTATATMAQISTVDDHRIFQRLVDVGGSGSGYGAIAVPISGASVGTVNARIRDAADGTTILQPEWQAGTISSGAATSVNITGVNARLAWFYVDIKALDGSWQLGTTPVGMGALFGFAGQSLIYRFLGRAVGDVGTYASNSLTANAFTRALISYDDGGGGGYKPTVATMPWQLPGDMTDNTGPSSTGIGEFLNRMVGMLGINCGAIGYGQGGVSIDTFIQPVTGSNNWTILASILARAGGAFEGFFWGQGHTDSAMGCPWGGYYDKLTYLFGTITAANSRSYFKRLWDIPCIGNNNWGTSWEYLQIRKAVDQWCADNSAVKVHMYDFAQPDAIHETQTGAITMARHMYRSTRAAYGQSSGIGPVPVSISCTAASTYVVTFSDVGQTDLVITGTLKNRMRLLPTGKYTNSQAANDNCYTISTVTKLSKTQIQFTTSVDPGQTTDFYLYYPGDGVTDATVDNLYDDVNPDGLAHGRMVAANSTPLTCAGSGGSANAPSVVVANTSPYNMTATSATYGTGATGFGQEITGGYAQISTTFGGPNFPSFTAECKFTCPPAFAATQVLLTGLPGGDWLGINTAGHLTSGHILGDLGTQGSTLLVAGHRYHTALVAGPTGYRVYLTDITAAGSGTRDLNDPTAAFTWRTGAGHGFGVRCLNGGSFALSGGAVDEFAIWRGEKYTGSTYTTPTSPYVGNETDLIALWHFDNDAKCVVGA